jgi:hypothetical protein
VWIRPDLGHQGGVLRGLMQYLGCEVPRIPIVRLSDKSLDGPQRFVLVALKVAKMVLVGEF